MNIPQQIWHLWRKDWLRTRWLFLLLCAITGAAVMLSRPAAHSYLCSPIHECDNRLLLPIQLLCALVAMLFVASIVQDDSPTTDTPFWATHPISVKALLGAKFVYVFGSTIALVLIAQTASLFLNGFAIWPSLPSIGITLYWVVSLMLVSVILSATLATMQSFILLSVGCLLLRIITMAGLQNPSRVTVWLSRQDWAGFRADIWLALAFAAAAWLYAARTVRTRTRVSIVWGTLAILIVGWNSGLSGAVRFLSAAYEQPNPNSPAVQYGVTKSDSNFLIRVSTVTPAPRRRYALACPSYAVMFADGSRSVPSRNVSCNEWRTDAAVPLTKDALNSRADSVSTMLSVPRFGFDIARDLTRGTTLIVEGYVEEQSEGETTELSVETPSIAAEGTHRFIKTYHEATIGDRNYQRLEIQIQNAWERVIAVPGAARIKQLSKSVGNVYIPPDYLKDNGYEIRAINSSGSDTVLMSIDSLQGSSARYQTRGNNRLSLAFPGLDIAQSQERFFPVCIPQCNEAAWSSGRIIVTPWKHVHYAPFHLEIPLPIREP